MHAGLVSTTLGLGGIPAEAEQLMIARDLLLNRTIGCRYHVQHISIVLPPSLKLRRTAVARSAEAGRQAQDERCTDSVKRSASATRRRTAPPPSR